MSFSELIVVSIELSNILLNIQIICHMFFAKFAFVIVHVIIILLLNVDFWIQTSQCERVFKILVDLCVI